MDRTIARQRCHVLYEVNDEQPLLNRIEVDIVDVGGDSIEDSHVLDFNLRMGFDASTVDDLDTQAVLLPYIDPILFGDSASSFQTNIVVPEDWLDGYTDGDYRVDLRAIDIWGNETSLSIHAVPEPAHVGAMLALVVLFWSARRRDCPNRGGRPVCR